MQIHHIARADRWEAAKLAGSYAWSTLDQTLEEVGFIHACRADQLEGVLERHYAGVSAPLVLLTIDTDKLSAAWHEESVGDDTYPHLYGPLNPSAVVATVPLASQAPTAPVAPAASTPRPAPPQGEGSFSREFFGEVAFRAIAALAVMVAAIVLGTIAGEAGDQALTFPVALATLVVGFLVARFVYKRRQA